MKKRLHFYPSLTHFVLGCLLVTHPALSLADKGGETGGGGHTVQLPSGQIVSADPYAIKLDDPFGAESRNLTFEGKDYQLTDEDKKSLDQAFKLLYGHGADQVEDFSKNQIYAKEVHYYLVNQFPDHPYCKQIALLPDLPTGAKSSQSFCTVGNLTFILASPFANLSRIDQTMELIHERLRAWRPGLSLEVIAAVTTGVQTMLNLAELQRGPTPNYEVTPDQLRSLHNMLIGLSMTQLSSNQKIISYTGIAEKGGGRCGSENTKILVSVDNAVVASPDLQGFTFFNSDGITPLELKGDGAIVLNVKSARGDLGAQSKIENTAVNTFQLGDSAEATQVTAGNLVMGQNSSLDKVNAKDNAVFIGADSHLSEVTGPGMTVGDHSNLTRVEYNTPQTGTFALTVGKDTTLQDFVYHSTEYSVPITIDGGEVSHVQLSSKVTIKRPNKESESPSDLHLSLKQLSISNVGPTVLYWNIVGGKTVLLEDRSIVHYTIDGEQETANFEGKPLDSVCSPGKHLVFEDPRKKCYKDNTIMWLAAVPTFGGSAMVLGSKIDRDCSGEITIKFKDLKNLCKEVPGAP